MLMYVFIGLNVQNVKIKLNNYMKNYLTEELKNKIKAKIARLKIDFVLNNSFYRNPLKIYETDNK